MSIKFSVFLPTGFAAEFAAGSDPVGAYERITEIAKVADESGFATLWLADHFAPAVPLQVPVFEAWVSTAALARDTRRIRVGQLVTGNGYRNPALVAKMASTVDVISQGRLAFGIGAGWHEPDYAGYGFDFDDAPGRLRRLAEAVRVIRGLWTEDEFSFDGKYYRTEGAVNQPKGVQDRIPMLIAGGGEKVTLKLAARYADACNVIESPDGLARKYEVLRRHCVDVGRDPASVLRTSCTFCVIADTDEEAVARIPPWASAIYPGDYASYCLVGTLDTISARIAAYEAAGVQELAITFDQAIEDPSVLRTFAAEFIEH